VAPVTETAVPPTEGVTEQPDNVALRVSVAGLGVAVPAVVWGFENLTDAEVKPLQATV
jgi:hypothetical protein